MSKNLTAAPSASSDFERNQRKNNNSVFWHAACVSALQHANEHGGPGALHVSFGGSFCAASTALTLSLASLAAQAQPALPVGTNLEFTQVANPGNIKGTFTSVGPVGWSGGGTGYISIDAPIAGEDGASSNTKGATVLQTYGDPVGSVPGNYVQADGNPV